MRLVSRWVDGRAAIHDQLLQSNPDIAGKANPAQAEHRFKPKKKINDPIFLVLFIATFAGMIVVAALAIRQFVKYNGGNGGFGDNGEGGTGISTSLN